MKKLTLLFIVLLLLPIVTPTTYTSSIETNCNNGICSKVLYSGVRFVEEDKEWVRIEKAKSLKDKGFNVVFLEDDKKWLAKPLAGLTILSSVAKLTAEYETKLDVPVTRSLVMSNGREVVKEAYMSVGRPDLYHDDIVHYVTDEQFGYVAAVDGIMVREKPAACFYLGAFFAESLILAETGNHVGAIQIAGTAMPTQLPFFVAACDYTLIGEELFAASAYLSGDKRQIASLRGQDVGKLIAMGAILVGSALTTIGGLSGGEGFFAGLSDAFKRLFAMNF